MSDRRTPPAPVRSRGPRAPPSRGPPPASCWPDGWRRAGRPRRPRRRRTTPPPRSVRGHRSGSPRCGSAAPGWSGSAAAADRSPRPSLRGTRSGTGSGSSPRSGGRRGRSVRAAARASWRVRRRRAARVPHPGARRRGSAGRLHRRGGRPRRAAPRSAAAAGRAWRPALLGGTARTRDRGSPHRHAAPWPGRRRWPRPGLWCVRTPVRYPRSPARRRRPAAPRVAVRCRRAWRVPYPPPR